MSTCRSCGAAVIWVRLLPLGRENPLDEKPTASGNIRMAGTRNAVARVLKKAELAAARRLGEHLYTSHFATCPNAAAHRKG